MCPRRVWVSRRAKAAVVLGTWPETFTGVCLAEPALRSHRACAFAHLANKDKTEGQGPAGTS